ncbi:hypothetical protein CK203_093520 [Vitis vinifera]|uniref:Uncharacterized protein n=1 Tax=Vitis vinifera TaxID=29760 RepID=A0A438D6D5_VITVI|nr:hypothetical protein CK203_093520 [Vitis vinifera]
MATPSRSQSSGKGVDDNFEWRQTIERRQLASERQLKALLQETERLREENVVLRIQLQHQGLLDVSIQRPSSKLKASTRTGINISWDNRAIPGACNVRPHEPRTPMPRVPREESSDLLTFQQKDNVIKNPSCQIRCAQD